MSSRWFPFSPRVRRLVGFSLRIALVAVVVLLVAWNWDQLSAVAGQFNMGLFVLAALLYPVSFVLVLIVWLWLVELQLGSFQWRRDLAIYCYSNIMRNLPFGFFWRIGGFVVLYANEKVSRTTAVQVPLWEMVLHVTAAALLLLIALLFRPIVVGYWFWGLLFALAALALFVVARRLSKRQGQAATGDWQSALVALVGMVRRRGRTMLSILVLDAITWLNASLILQILVFAIDPRASFDYVDAVETSMVAGLFAYLAMPFPFVAAGAREATITVLLLPFVSPPVALVVALGYRLILTISDIFWSGLTLLVVRRGSARAEPEVRANPERGVY